MMFLILTSSMILFVTVDAFLIDRTSTSTTVQPYDNDIHNWLPLKGKNLEGTLRRALDIVTKSKATIKRPHRGPNFDTPARSLLGMLTQDATYEEPSSSSSQDSPTRRPRNDDVDFCLPSTSSGSGRRTSLETMKKIVDLADHGRSEEAIRRKYSWYRRQYLPDFRRCVEQGGSRHTKIQEINEFVKNETDYLIDNNFRLKGYVIRALGRRAARRFQAPWFKASKGWIDEFKRKYRIGSRKVNKYISRPMRLNEAQIEANKQAFIREYSRLSRFFHRRQIWNIDQTGVEYESSNQRTLARIGTKVVRQRIDSLNKNTHSYTGQPILSRDGRLLGKLLLCTQESTGEFGPRVQKTVDELERKYKNIRVVSSKSGKMTTDLMRTWIRDVLAPTVRQNIFYGDSDDIESYRPDREDEETLERLQGYDAIACRSISFWGRIFETTNETCIENRRLLALHIARHPYVLLLSDSWSGQTNMILRDQLRTTGVKNLTVPPHTTGDVQPLDVGFFLQLKKFIRRITEEAVVEDVIGEITSREGIINLMSLIYNQLQSPAYYDLWRFAWRNTDPSFSEDELTNVPPANVNSVQFGYDPYEMCSVENCTEEVVLRCSHCGRSLCLRHFINRTCFHDIDDETDEIAQQAHFGPGREEAVDEVDDLDDELAFVVDETCQINQQASTTTTQAPDPLMEQIYGTCGC